MGRRPGFGGILLIVLRRARQATFGIAGLLVAGLISGTFFAPLEGPVVVAVLAVALFAGVLGVIIEIFEVSVEEDEKAKLARRATARPD